MSVANHGVASLGFPIKRHDSDYIVLDFDSPKAHLLEYYYVSSFDHMFVLPTAAISPLHALVMKRTKPSLKTGVYLKVSGPPMRMLEFQARRGFAHVGEKALTALSRELGVAESAVTDDGVVAEDVIAAGLTLAICPKMHRDEFAQAMSLRKVLEGGQETDMAEELSQEVLDDVLNASDRSHIQEGKKKLQQSRVKLAARRVAVQKCIDMFAPKLQKQRTTKSKLSAKVERLVREKGLRWWADMQCDATLVLQWKPEDCHVVVDRNNGRFLFRHSKVQCDRRSISWTQRGMDEAVKASLRIMWEWEVEWRGGTCPLPSEWIGDLFA